jgi:hypothetical protein
MGRSPQPDGSDALVASPSRSPASGGLDALRPDAGRTDDCPEADHRPAAGRHDGVWVAHAGRWLRSRPVRAGPGASGPGDISGEALKLKSLVRVEDLYSSDLCPENE